MSDPIKDIGSHLPIAELVEAIGWPATLRLVERFGGVRIYLPQAEHLGETHPIARCIGQDAARTLARIWPQERPYLPRCITELRALRDAQLNADMDAGMSFSQAALKYKLTERQVYNIRAALAKAAALAKTAEPAKDDMAARQGSLL